MNKTERYQDIGFFTYYSNEVLEKTLTIYREYGNHITLYFRDGTNKQVQVPIAYPLESFHLQFGITVSLPFHVLFIQSWEHGLCCIDIDSSDILWRIPKKHAYEVYAVKESVYVHFVDNGLYKIDIITGECVKRFPYTLGGVFFSLPEHGFFVGPLRGKYIILDYDLCVKFSIPKDLLNPNRFEVFLIHNVDIVEQQLYVCGMEFSNAAETDTMDCRSMKFERHFYIEDLSRQLP